MISVAECDAKIELFTNVMRDVMGLISGLEECSAQTTRTISYSRELIINGEPVDTGSLDSLPKVLESVAANLNALVNECVALINKYEALKAEAIAYMKYLEELRMQEQIHLR